MAEEIHGVQIHLVDLVQVPLIYPTDNPDHFGRWCIDLFPESVPTIASFTTKAEAHAHLMEVFGADQHMRWFPELYKKRYASCQGCGDYVEAQHVLHGYCFPCRQITRWSNRRLLKDPFTGLVAETPAINAGEAKLREEQGDSGDRRA